MTNSLRLSKVVYPQDIFDGGFTTLELVPESQEILEHARKIIRDVFDCEPEEVELQPSDDYEEFAAKASKVKTTFTDGSVTRELVKKLVAARYDEKYVPHMLIDPPRLRVIPNSNTLSSGVSYNYKPHRDTWYGGPQAQINHWMPVANVTTESTMYVAPEFFYREVLNNSEIFNLDEWDQKYRKQAISNIKQEERPHPVPLVEIPENTKSYIVIPNGTEMVFSAHHFHGSGTNTTKNVRFSLDYRVTIETQGWTYPPNIDNRCVGDMRKYMFPAV